MSYSDDEAYMLQSMYKNAASVSEISNALGKSTRSVIAKLSQMGLYKAPERTAAKRNGVTKGDMVCQLSTLCGVNPEALESLSTATRSALQIVIQNLRK